MATLGTTQNPDFGKGKLNNDFKDANYFDCKHAFFVIGTISLLFNAMMF